MDKYIINPQTGRIVLKTGKIGQLILKTFNSEELKELEKTTIERQKRRLALQNCDYGLVWSSKNKVCMDRKSDSGKQIVQCQKQKIKLILEEFKNNKLLNINKDIVKNRKQALAIALSEANQYC